MTSGGFGATERGGQTPQPASQTEGAASVAPRCIACVQPRRGHGVTVATYYLAQALAGRGLRALVMDLTGRRARLQWLAARGQTPGLTIWAPHIPQPERLGDALARAREQAAGKVDVILLDMDASYLQRAGGVAAGIDYALIFIEHSEMGMREADALAERLDESPPPWGVVAAVFTRVNASSLHDLPQSTPERGLPVLGELPADYLLAAGDDYSLKGEEPRAPHDTYLGAVNRLARSLVQMAQIVSGAHVASPQPSRTPPDTSGPSSP
ncbi:MAG TPA: hypothetical protein VFQ25_03240 [Ktedonobacterales bacterium]|nr:hypothetical protein [Ktedonobacterales bacterium]